MRAYKVIFLTLKKTNEMGRLQTINELNVKGRKRPSLPPAGGGAAPAPPAPPSKGFFLNFKHGSGRQDSGLTCTSV